MHSRHDSQLIPIKFANAQMPKAWKHRKLKGNSLLKQVIDLYRFFLLFLYYFLFNIK